jgi:hypothetical protein
MTSHEELNIHIFLLNLYLSLSWHFVGKSIVDRYFGGYSRRHYKFRQFFVGVFLYYHHWFILNIRQLIRIQFDVRIHESVIG